MHLLCSRTTLGLICGIAVAACASPTFAQPTPAPAPADDSVGQAQPSPDDGGPSDDGLIGTLPADDSANGAIEPPPENPDLDFDNIGSPFPLCGFGLLFGSGGALVGLIATISVRFPGGRSSR